MKHKTIIIFIIATLLLVGCSPKGPTPAEIVMEMLEENFAMMDDVLDKDNTVDYLEEVAYQTDVRQNQMMEAAGELPNKEKGAIRLYLNWTNEVLRRYQEVIAGIDAITRSSDYTLTVDLLFAIDSLDYAWEKASSAEEKLFESLDINIKTSPSSIFRKHKDSIPKELRKHHSRYSTT